MEVMDSGIEWKTYKQLKIGRSGDCLAFIYVLMDEYRK